MPTEVDGGAGDALSGEALDALAGRGDYRVELGTCGADVIGSCASVTVLHRAVEALSFEGGEASGTGGAEIICGAGEAVREGAGDACFVLVVHGEGGRALVAGSLQHTEIAVGDVAIQADVVGVQLVSGVAGCTDIIGVASCTLGVVKASAL